MKKSLIFVAVALVATASCTKAAYDPIASGLTGEIGTDSFDIKNVLNWNSSADFSFFNGTTANQRFIIASGAGSKTGTFSAAGSASTGDDINAAVAVAPYSEGVKVKFADSKATATAIIPSYYSVPTAGFTDAPLIAIAAKNPSKLTFQPYFGSVAVALTGELAISKVTFTANAKETINGTFTVKADANSVISAESAEDGTSSVTVEYATPVQLTSVAREFPVFVPAGTYSKGFTVTVVSTDGAENEFAFEESATVKMGRCVTIGSALPAPFVDLNEGTTERANSYVITKAGAYFFDATVKGNGDAGLHSTFSEDKSTKLDPKGAKLLWSEVKGLVGAVALKDGKIRFSCNGKSGNAVIAATDAEGNIIWSWHIWSGEYKTVDVPGPDGATATFMDRHLGATTDKDAGLYYQWGRKDPFSKVLGFDSAAGEGNYHPVAGGQDHTDQCNIKFATAHPETYIANCGIESDWLLERKQHKLWGMDWETEGNIFYQELKTIYDPCPAGWFVASATAFANGYGSLTVSGEGQTFYDGKIYFPFNAFIYNGGYGWWGDAPANYFSVWTCSTAWGNTEQAFRSQPSDPRGYYDRACGCPVRCIKRP